MSDTPHTTSHRFRPGDIVSHALDEAAHGMITAFMVRGTNHSYEVAWGIEKCTWHLEAELQAVPTLKPEIGYHKT
jgi:hypothetical protein